MRAKYPSVDVYFIQNDEIKIGNETKLVDVLYLGVAVAYYADKEGKIGGMLVPAEKEWQMVEKNELAPAVHQAILYYTNEIKPAMMVDLPIEIKDLKIGN